MEGGLPYQPFVEAVEQLARVVPASDLRQWLGDAGPELARLAPGLRRLFPELPLAAQVAPEEGRRLLQSAWSDFLERAAGVRPILLVLDDVHWADDSSLLLVQHIARRLAEIPVQVLCTWQQKMRGWAATWPTYRTPGSQRDVRMVTAMTLATSDAKPLARMCTARPTSCAGTN